MIFSIVSVNVVIRNIIVIFFSVFSDFQKLIICICLWSTFLIRYSSAGDGFVGVFVWELKQVLIVVFIRAIFLRVRPPCFRVKCRMVAETLRSIFLQCFSILNTH